MSLEIRYSDAPQKDIVWIDRPSYVNTSISNWEGYRENGSPDIPYATAEENVWKLDGTRKILQGTGEFMIFGDGTDHLSVSVYTGGKVSVPGITIRFSPSTNQYPYMVQIWWKNGNTTLYEKTYYPNSPILNESKRVDGVERIQIYVQAKPKEFIKIQRITLGNEIVFGKGSLANVRMTTEFDPSLCSLPADTLSAHVKTRDGMNFEPSEGARIKLFKNGVLEHTQFLQDFDRIEKNQYKLSCQSLIGTLDREYYGKILTPGGVINSDERAGNVWCTASKEIGRISGEGERFSVKYETSHMQENTVLIGYIPVCEEKEALRQVLFASDMAASTRDGYLTLCDLKDAVTSEFTKEDIIAWRQVKKLKPIGSVEIWSLYEKYVDQKSEEVFSYQGETKKTQRIAHYMEKPRYGAPVPSINGTYGAGWATLYDTGTLSADEYIEYSKIRNTAPVPDGEKSGATITIDDCTLIHDEVMYESDWEGSDEAFELIASNALPKALERMVEYAQLRVMVEEDVIVTNQHAGDFVRTLTPWGTKIEGYIIAMDATLTQNGHRARIKILGKEVS